MGYFLKTDVSDPAPLASVAGWADFKAWANGLDTEDYPEIHHLALYGWSQSLSDLKDELTAAVKSGKPAADVKSTAKDLIATLTAAPKAKAAIVTDGLGT